MMVVREALAEAFAKPLQIQRDPTKSPSYGPLPSQYEELGNMLRDEINVATRKRSFLGVACFSETDDDLNQWRGYATLGQGVSVRFDFGRLQKTAKARLVQCNYNRSDVRAWAHEIRDWFEEQMGSPYDYLEVMMQHYVARSLEAGAGYKHEAFKDEKEWRLVTPAYGAIHYEAPRSASDMPPDLKFRAGAFSLLPYTTLNIKDADGWAIAGVCIGPTREKDLARNAVIEALYSYGVFDPKPDHELGDWVWHSKVPFRAV
jgi:hypothetical protein